MRQLNVGVIGLGPQGKRHLRNCLRLKDIKVLGAADISEKALEYAREKGVKNVYPNYEDLLKNEQLDAVIISLPNFCHVEGAVKAAEAGKDIFLEKPLARNVEEGKEIVSCARKNGAKLMLGYEMRFNPVLRRMHDSIADGLFGKVRIAEATNIGGGPFGPRSDRVGPIQVPSWWFDKELSGGGALLDLGSHLVNLLTWYFGEVANVKSYLGYLFNMEHEDTATCILRFKDGPVATIKAGWFSSGFMQTVQICGTVKTELVEMSRRSTSSKVWTGVESRLGWRRTRATYLALEHFVRCLQNDEEPHPSGEEGLRDLEIISRAYENSVKYS